MTQEIPRYNVRETEAKWQRHWHEKNTFAATEDEKKKKYYVLEMFPYPSGNIHMGHVRNYTLGDVVARSKRAQGYNVMHPMGWDAFGLPAENAAIQNSSHPGDWTFANIDTMRGQLKLIGLAYDWQRELATCTPEYYKHEQQFFLRFLKNGLAYRKEALVNWDPVDNTVLANEQVIDGKGWRSGAPVERRTLSQWFLRISDFCEDLLAGLDTLEKWPDKVRLMQEKWIGKSYGAMVTLKVLCKKPGKDPIESNIEIYTTRPDTFYGMSFVAIAPEHPLALDIVAHNPEAAEFVAECARGGTSEEAIEKAEKKGFDTGLVAVNPFTGTEHPLYIANFVLMGYGTGAVFGCPAHDQRDFEFAVKYGLPVLPVVSPQSPVASIVESSGDQRLETEDLPYLGDGFLVNSDFLNGLSVDEAKKAATSELEKQGCGTAKVNYRLRDWGVSRQRYWGCPIPIIHCEVCGIVPVPEKQLPVELPRDVKFDKPGNPLDHHPTWKHVDCPQCGKPSRRETDTFDTFFESSWYFARYTAPHAVEAFDAKALAYWMPVDCYIGGIEHAVLHLLYSRFFSRALNKCGMVDFKEPFVRLETQGMVCHETYKSEEGKWLSPEEITPAGAGKYTETKTGKPVAVGRIEKMSKSKKNTVDPRYIMETYGADAARLFMLSDSPPERDLEWSDAGIEGAWRYINRVWKLVLENKAALGAALQDNDASLPIRKATHKTIAAIGDDLEAFRFNKAIARIRELTNFLEGVKLDAQNSGAFAEAIKTVIQLLNPFMPHLTEELWEQLGNKNTLADVVWPVAIPEFLVDDSITIAIQINGKLKTTLELPKDMDAKLVEEKVLELAAIKEAIKDLQVAKIIVVPNRIVNVVAK
ncbi:MAG: leucine--tRNA ligase [Alphaproteobacteria bacterium]|nr:leucine--tRNA ligase [Alphaproteobacteria bacterium]